MTWKVLQVFEMQVIHLKTETTSSYYLHDTIQLLDTIILFYEPAQWIPLLLSDLLCLFYLNPEEGALW